MGTRRTTPSASGVTLKKPEDPAALARTGRLQTTPGASKNADGTEAAPFERTAAGSGWRTHFPPRASSKSNWYPRTNRPPASTFARALSVFSASAGSPSRERLAPRSRRISPERDARDVRSGSAKSMSSPTAAAPISRIFSRSRATR